MLENRDQMGKTKEEYGDSDALLEKADWRIDKPQKEAVITRELEVENTKKLKEEYQIIKKEHLYGIQEQPNAVESEKVKLIREARKKDALRWRWKKFTDGEKFHWYDNEIEKYQEKISQLINLARRELLEEDIDVAEEVFYEMIAKGYNLNLSIENEGKSLDMHFLKEIIRVIFNTLRGKPSSFKRITIHRNEYWPHSNISRGYWVEIFSLDEFKKFADDIKSRLENDINEELIKNHQRKHG